MIFSATSPVFTPATGSQPANRVNTCIQASADKEKQNTCEVRVSFAPDFPYRSVNPTIAITEENGCNVVPAQSFHPGVQPDAFEEAGGLSGTRIAAMVPCAASQTSWIIPPCKLTGNFYGGTFYLIKLTPGANNKTGHKDL